MRKVKIKIAKSGGEWRAEVADLPELADKIEVSGSSKEEVLYRSQARVLQKLADLLESPGIKLNGISFKIDDRSITGNKFSKLKIKIAKYLKKPQKWIIKYPLLEYTLLVIIKTSVAYIIFLALVLSALVAALIYSLFQNKQVAATIIGALTAFVGVVTSGAIQAWITTLKNKFELRKVKIEEMTSYYEKICLVLKKPQFFSPEEVTKFIDEFDRKIEIYGGTNILYQWKRIKEKILVLQFEPLKTEIEDWHDIRNFIGAIRKEMGSNSKSVENRFYIYQDLEAIYRRKRRE